MKADIINWDNEATGQLDLSDKVFGCDPRIDIIHRVIRWQLAKRQSGTHHTKQRGEVAGSTRKIRAQKGTGGARHGAITANIFRGGGISFGPRFRSHAHKLTKKFRALALRHVLSTKFGQSQLSIVDTVELESSKTKDFVTKMKALGAKSVLIVDVEVNENLKKSSANVYNTNVLPVSALNVYDMVRHDKLILTVAAVKKIEERLG